MAEMYLSKKDLASIAGYTYRRLYDIDKAAEKDKKLFVAGEGGKYCLSIFVQRWVQYNIEHQNDGPEDLDAEKAMHERVKREKSEIELSRMRGEVVPIQDVQRAWMDIAGVVSSRFINLPRKLAPALVMIGDPAVIEGIIERDVRDALNMIANTPLPGEGQAAPEDDEGDAE